MTRYDSLSRGLRLLVLPLAGIALFVTAVGAAPGKTTTQLTVHRTAIASRVISPRSNAAWLIGPPVPAALASPRATGMVVGIDPATGQLVMPTPDQIAKLGAVARERSGVTSARPAPVRHADGHVSMETRGWMREFSTVRIGQGGKLVYGCYDTPEAALGARHVITTPAKAEDR